MSCLRCGRDPSPRLVFTEYEIAPVGNPPRQRAPLRSWPALLQACSETCRTSVLAMAQYAASVSFWRVIAAPIIHRVLIEHDGAPRDVVERALRAAYPFPAPRKGHAYRVWRDEIARQTGRKPPLGARAPRRQTDPRQQPLFSAQKQHAPEGANLQGA